MMRVILAPSLTRRTLERRRAVEPRADVAEQKLGAFVDRAEILRILPPDARWHRPWYAP